MSTAARWSDYVEFFARGLEASARTTHERMLRLVAVERAMTDVVRGSSLRAENAHRPVDLALARTSLTVQTVRTELGLSYGRANALVGPLAELGLLVAPADAPGSSRRSYAPQVYDVLVGRSEP